MSASRVPAFVLCLGVLLAAPATSAQIEEVSFNYGRIVWQYHAADATTATDPMPFGLDLALAPDGSSSAVLRTWKATDVTLKRGIIGAAAPATGDLLEFELRPRGGMIAGDGRAYVVVGTGGGGHVRVFDGSTAQGEPTAHLELSTPADAAAAGGPLSLRVQPAPGVRLIGMPASLFNRPAAGEPLVGLFPAALAGEGKKVKIDFVKTSASQPTTVVLTIESLPGR